MFFPLKKLSTATLPKKRPNIGVSQHIFLGVVSQHIKVRACVPCRCSAWTYAPNACMQFPPSSPNCPPLTPALPSPEGDRSNLFCSLRSGFPYTPRFVQQQIDQSGLNDAC